MLSNKNVLVVEDDSSIRNLVTSVLKQQLNCKNVTEAVSAEDALEFLLSGAKVDIIFSDWEMPGMKGDEFLFNVRTDPSFKETPFIMITCRSERDALVTAIQAGVSEYVFKPFSPATLIQKIGKVLSHPASMVTADGQAQSLRGSLS